MNSLHSESLWKLVKDLNKGTIGFYRDGIPYCVFSFEQWARLLANPVIIGKPNNDKPKDDDASVDCDWPLGHA
jgi:hypothetical protein